MHISAFPLPLSITVYTVSAPITKDDDTAHEKNNRLKIQIGLPPLAQYSTTLQLDTGFIGD